MENVELIEELPGLMQWVEGGREIVILPLLCHMTYVELIEEFP
jgi:hypothetical protein